MRCGYSIKPASITGSLQPGICPVVSVQAGQGLWLLLQAAQGELNLPLQHDVDTGRQWPAGEQVVDAEQGKTVNIRPAGVGQQQGGMRYKFAAAYALFNQLQQNAEAAVARLYQRRILVALHNGTAEHQAVFFRILQGITQIGFASQLHIGGGTLLWADQC